VGIDGDAAVGEVYSLGEGLAGFGFGQPQVVFSRF
jgi:hypothetical protein